MAPLIGVVAVDIMAQPSRLEADDRVRLGIEGLVSSVDGHRDRETLDPVGAALKRFLHDETQQGGAPRAQPEGGGREDALQLRPNVCGGRSKPGSCLVRALSLASKAYDSESPPSAHRALRRNATVPAASQEAKPAAGPVPRTCSNMLYPPVRAVRLRTLRQGADREGGLPKLAHLIHRFPECELAIHRGYAQDSEFRGLCDDYEEAVTALRYWEAPGRLTP